MSTTCPGGVPRAGPARLQPALVYNDLRDTSPFTPDELLGRSFIVKYTRLFDY